MNTNPRIATLAKQLEAASAAYYAGGAPIMSDAQFDTLRDELEKLDPNHAFLKVVGAPAPSGGWNKVKHAIPMRSLNKAQPVDGDQHAELNAWAKGKAEPLIVTEKLDGISIALTYRNGKLAQALTRGDGETGEDITRNVLLMKGFPRILPDPGTVHVRGEVVCLKSDFKRHFPGESNPRNTASGTAKRQSDPAPCKHLTVISYQYLPNGMPPATKADELKQLASLGFTVPNYGVGSLQYVHGYYEQYVTLRRDQLDYDIDGLVVEVNDRDAREALGERNHRPAGAVAYKFPHEQKPTILRAIRWQVGKSGRVTPVAEFDTVNLAGANVKQASLHNVGNIQRLVDDHHTTRGILNACLSEGDQILVARRNDVIPYVEALLKEANGTALITPTDCPDCTKPLVMDGEYLVCTNHDECPAQVSGAIKRWLDKIGVLHFGDALVQALIDSGRVQTIPDLYKQDEKDLAANLYIGGRLAGGTVLKAYRNLRDKRKTSLPLHVFVGSLGIPMIGRSMAKTIVDAGFDSLNAMSKATPAQIAAIPGVGSTKAASFVEGYWDRLHIITGLLAVGVTYEVPKVGPLSGKTFCQTGVRDNQLAAALEGAGASQKSSVSKGLDYLICLDKSGSSGKLTKARQYGTEIMEVDDAWKLIGGRP
jgi:DNA ligase (NAD+)